MWKGGGDVDWILEIIGWIKGENIGKVGSGPSSMDLVDELIP